MPLATGRSERPSVIQRTGPLPLTIGTSVRHPIGDTVLMAQVDPGPFTSAIRRALDQPMTERGFSPGQGNDYTAPVNVIYCAALDDFERQWPALFERVNARYGDDLRGPGTCIDLTIAGSIETGILTADLEGVPVDQLTPEGCASTDADSHSLDQQLVHLAVWVDQALPIL